MTARSLLRVHAYVVEPSAESQPLEVVGGSIAVTTELGRVLEGSYTMLDSEGFGVDLRVDPETRDSEVRGLLQVYAFGATRAPQGAAAGIAQRLARALDGRSSQCLLVLAAYDLESRRQVALWTFPRDSAFRFRQGRGGDAQLDFLQDLFSQSSKLRKGALFSGASGDGRNDFIRGQVLDFQAKSQERQVAAFWIDRFLDARFAMKPQHVTRLLAQHLKKLSAQAAGNAAFQDQLLALALNLTTGPARTITVRGVVTDFFDEPHRKAVLEGLPPETLDSPFEVRRETFQKYANVEEFKLANGVEVQVPLGRVEKDVHVEADKLTIRSRVVARRLKSRRMSG